MFLVSMCVRKRSANAGAACWRTIPIFQRSESWTARWPLPSPSGAAVREAALSEEMADLEQSDHGLASRMRQDGQPHGALLDIHDARRWIALGKDLLDLVCIQRFENM